MTRSWVSKKKLIVLTWVVAAALLINSLSLRAQVAGATLSGTVADSTGAVLVNASVSIKNLATGITREITLDSKGLYSVPDLPPATYDVTISAPGFSTRIEHGVELAVGESRVLDVTLRPGGVDQQIQVQSVASTVDLTTSMISAEVTAETLRDLPLNGRDWTQLATLQPGIITVRVQASSSNIGGRGNRGFGNQLADTGHSPYMNNYRINGISAVDYSNGSPGSVLGGQLGVDGIDEFSVQTTNYPAEYGRSAGAVINAITRSGTNQFHGSLYWFLRDDKLDARNYFDPPQIAPFHRNQFGASGGGPIQKDKTFIFANYEGIRQDLGVTYQDTVPTAAARAGSLCSVPTTGTCTPTTIAVNPLVAPFLKLWPLPNGALVSTGNGDTGFFNTGTTAPIVEDYLTVRVDHHFSSNDTLSGSYSYDKSDQVTPDALLLSTNRDLSKRQLATLEWNHVFNSAIVNSARIGYNRPQEELNAPVTALNPLADDTSLGALPGKYSPILQVPGLTNVQGSLGALPISTQAMNSIQAYDDLSITKGKHALKFGGAIENIRQNMEIVVRQNGAFSFPSLQGFLENEPTNVTLLDLSQLQEVGARQTVFGLYAQDDWRVRSNLTINLGLRYEPTTIPTEAHNRLEAIRNFYGGPIVPINALWDSNPTLRDFAPRVGFSWDPTGAGTTVIRSGFGIYDALPLPWTWIAPMADSYPFSLFVGTGNLPPGSFPTGAASLVPFTTQFASAFYTPPDPKRSYVMNWNLNVQHQFSGSVIGAVSYVGSHSLHGYWHSDDQDMVLPTLTSAGYLWPYPVGSGTRLNPLVGTIGPVFNDVSGSYNGLVAGVTKRFSHNFQAQGSYTYSKCLDTGSTGPATSPFDNTVADPPFFIPQARNGACDFDVRQNFVGNYLWRLPNPNFGGAVGNKVLGGWAIGGVLTLATGTPFTVYIGGDSLGQNSTGPVNYPDRVASPGCDDPVNPGNPNNYLKLNCFTPPIAPPAFAALCQPAAASVAAAIPNTCMNLFGNNGRNSIYGPGVADWDFSVMKDTHISESLNVQFRAEFFNILNHANFQSPLDNSTVLNQDGTATPGAGVIDATTTTSRQIQLGLKLIW
jgi:hypothetical protein